MRCGISITTGEQDCVVVDYGIGQINHKTVKNFKFDTKKLLSDLAYSVDASAKVLADFKAKYPKDPEFWTRYNAGNKLDAVTKAKRSTYKHLVARYF
jgi:hypothetical protein